MKKKIGKIVFKVFFVLFVLLILSASFWFRHQFSAPSDNKELVRFVVKQNVSEKIIIDDLFEEKFIRNKKIFTLFLNYICFRKKSCPAEENRIFAGSYKISRNMNAYKLAEAFALGPYQKWVVITSGKRKEQVALILRKTFNWQEDEILNFIKTTEEGYLYPDTYLIDIQADPKSVYQKLKNNFNEKFSTDLQRELFKQNIRYDTAVKIASLIERESGGDEDKPIIAGIIFNRLKKGMKLQIDATVQYASASKKCGVFDENCVWWPKVTLSMYYSIISPYNTYLKQGLPPGPICSPSIESIRAVANPAKTDALYYLHSPDKQIHTAKTSKGHQENIEKYLR